VRRLEENDIAFVYDMVTLEDWNDRIEDIRRMLEYEREGCFIAEANGEPAGHVFTVNYGKLGWISLLIVKSEHRKEGIGTLLMRRAIDYLITRGVETIRLEAVPEIVNLYRKLEFVDEYYSLRFVGKTVKNVSSEIHCVSSMQLEDITSVAWFDQKYFGANRKRVIGKLFQESPQYCFVSRSENGIISGYAMCRKAKIGYKLGPWTCAPRASEMARWLFRRCLETIGEGEMVYVGVPEVNEGAVEILKDHGFRQYSKSIRMYYGKKLAECVSGVFAIGGPMKG